MRKLLLFIVFIFLFVNAVVAQSIAIRYVKQDGTGDGSSWANASGDLRTMIETSSFNTEIWVAKGTYYPTTDPNNRNASFVLKSGVAIYGGFVGGEQSRNERDWKENKTVLSGDINRKTVENPFRNDSNSFHVVYSSNANGTAVLDGFTITSGLATGRGSNRNGGGMYNLSSSPTVINCSFTGSFAWGYGGGMYNEASSFPKLSNCDFTNNYTSSEGAGMYNNNSSPNLTDCIFKNNQAVEGGGMVNFNHSSPILANCSFENNYVGGWGGGMYNNSYSSPKLTNCSFVNNNADGAGGGISNASLSSPTLTNCNFSKNSAGNNGGGISNNGSSSPVLTGCRFTDNRSSWIGGGMSNNYSSPTLNNCSFVNNNADGGGSSGGGMYNQGSSPILTRCDFSDNYVRYEGGGMYNTESSSPKLTNCSFVNNRAEDLDGGTGRGGGMFNNESSPTLTNCSFVANQTSFGGAGMFNNNSSPKLANCKFMNNNASLDAGGGMYNLFSSSPMLTNCSFVNNRAGAGGGGMLNHESSSPTLTNCSFTANYAACCGGGMANVNFSSPTLINCIVWKNSSPSSAEILNSTNGNAMITFSIIRGGYNGEGNQDVDPLFIDAENGNLRLQACSPAINAGNDEANLTEKDLDDNPRKVGVIDMGAYEFQNADPGCKKVVSFTLVNASTNIDIEQLQEGAIINLATIQKMEINIRANTTPATVGSVVFHLEGPTTRTHTENLIPYALFGDDMKGGYYGATLPVGEYILTATPYSGAKGIGAKGTPLTIHFKVVYAAFVSSLTLVNADSDKDFRQLKDGDVIDLTTLSTQQLNIRANTSPGTVGSVILELSGAKMHRRLETGPPYALFSNLGADYYGSSLPVGDYSLTATPFSGPNGTGTQGTPHNIRFKVVQSPALSGFTLVRGGTNQDIGPLVNGAVVDLSIVPNISVRANPAAGSNIGSVRFDLNSTTTYQMENIAPYALRGDNNGIYNNWQVTPGVYTITATPYSERNGGGIAGKPVSITITIRKPEMTLTMITANGKSSGENIYEPGKEKWHLTTYPNPVVTSAFVEFRLPHTTQASVTLVDVSGRTYQQVFNGKADGQVLYKKELRMQGLVRGVYFVRLLTQEGKMMTYQIVYQ